jgi:hypothetical protein
VGGASKFLIEAMQDVGDVGDTSKSMAIHASRPHRSIFYTKFSVSSTISANAA